MALLFKIKSLNWREIIILILAGIVVAGVLATLGMTVYCWVVYGGKPVSEIPVWALWFMFGKGK